MPLTMANIGEVNETRELVEMKKQGDSLRISDL